MYFQVFYYSTSLFVSSGLTEESAKFATIGIGAIMVVMTLVSIPLMDKTGRRTLHLYGLGGMFIFSIFITISFLIKVGSLAIRHLSLVMVQSNGDGGNRNAASCLYPDVLFLAVSQKAVLR